MGSSPSLAPSLGHFGSCLTCSLTGHWSDKSASVSLVRMIGWDALISTPTSGLPSARRADRTSFGSLVATEWSRRWGSTRIRGSPAIRRRIPLRTRGSSRRSAGTWLRSMESSIRIFLVGGGWGAIVLELGVCLPRVAIGRGVGPIRSPAIRPLYPARPVPSGTALISSPIALSPSAESHRL